MYLDVAVFENFRNIEHFPFTFSPGMNILFGGNAQGKTAVIEGIYLFAGGKSFRRARDKDMIKNNNPHVMMDPIIQRLANEKDINNTFSLARGEKL